MNRRLNYWAGVAAALWLGFGVGNQAQAFIVGVDTGFDLERNVDEATLIVRGRLEPDGRLLPEEVFKGETPAVTPVIQDGGKFFQAFQTRMAGTNSPGEAIELVAFLKPGFANGSLSPWMGFGGLAGLADTNVYLNAWGKDARGNSGSPALDEHFSRATLLAGVRAEVETDRQREALAALPRSAERAQRMVEFLKVHSQYYQQWKMEQALRPVDAAESRELVRELVGATDLADRVRLVTLAGDLVLGEDAFAVIAPWMDRQNPGELRRAAITAGERINPQATKHILLPMLHLADPELATVLRSLPRSELTALDGQVVEGLLTLSREVREQTQAGAQPLSNDFQIALEMALREYAHPRLAAFYYHWLKERPTPPVTERDEVAQDLDWCCTGGLTSKDWLSWWRQYGAVLEEEFHPGQPGETRRWLAAYAGADATARHLLLRWWMYAPGSNQLALVQAAMEPDTAETAKAALAGLWYEDRALVDGDHLGNEAKQALFQHFCQFTLVDTVGTNGYHFKNQHDLAAIGRFGFPFQGDISYITDLVVDGKSNADSVNQVVLEPEMREWQFGSLGGNVPGKTASASVDIFQLEHYPDGKKLWQAHWDVGPIELKEAR